MLKIYSLHPATYNEVLWSRLWSQETTGHKASRSHSTFLNLPQRGGGWELHEDMRALHQLSLLTWTPAPRVALSASKQDHGTTWGTARITTHASERTICIWSYIRRVLSYKFSDDFSFFCTSHVRVIHMTTSLHERLQSDT